MDEYVLKGGFMSRLNIQRLLYQHKQFCFFFFQLFYRFTICVAYNTLDSDKK